MTHYYCYYDYIISLPEHLTLYPGLLIPVFVACSTNAGEGLVKLMMYLDMGRSGTFLLYNCEAAL